MKLPRWLLLTHQLPAEPSNIRVKVWRKMRILGAVPVKNSIYVLPNTPSNREDFDWLRKEILQMKGECSIFLGNSISDVDDNDIIKAIQEARSEDFDRFTESVEALSAKIKGALEGGHIKRESLERFDKLWKNQKLDLQRLLRIDFFKASNRAKAESAAAAAQKLFQQAKTLSLKGIPAPPPPVDIGDFKGRLWVTRTSPHIDRLASAWLIRRHVDAHAGFKFVAPPYEPRSRKEVRFDMAEAEFTHFGDWCTFETLMHRLSLEDAALKAIAEIVHDIDLKDGKFGRLEASGVSHIVRGLCRLHGNDFKRLEAGIALFDALYAALKGEK